MTNTNVTALTVFGINIFAGNQSSGIFRSTDNGMNWTDVNNGLTDKDVLSLAVSGTNLFAGTWGGGVFLSTNSGTNWTAVNNGLTSTYVYSFTVSGTNIFAGTGDEGVFLSTNNGLSWAAVNNGLTNSQVWALAVSRTNLFAGTFGGGIFLSTDSGTNWTSVNNGLTDLYVMTLAAMGEKIFAGTYGGGVFLSTNNGTTWTAVNNSLSNTYVHSLIVSGTNLFAGTDYVYEGGIYLSTDSGTSWALVNEGLTNTTIYSFAIGNGNLYAGTKSRSVWRRPLSEMVPSNGNIARYSFTGNANDSSGNGYHGTTHYNPQLVNDRFGYTASAYEFNGFNQFIELPSEITITSDLSISFWVNTTVVDTNSWPGARFLIDRDVCAGARDWSIGLGRGGKIQFQTGTGGLDDILTGSIDVNDNTWHHVVVIRDSAGQTKKIYIDSQLDTVSSFDDLQFQNNYLPIYFAATVCQPGTHKYFPGTIDDIRLYSRPLSEQEVELLFTEGGWIPPITFQLTVPIINGWNMVSVPGTNPEGMGVDTWWSGKDPAANVFKYGTGYQQVTSATPGEGYFMKHIGAQVYNTGDEWPAGGIQIVSHEPITGLSGWNLFGGYELVVGTAGITTVPPGLQNSPVYKYGAGYEIATTLEPGYGYWLKLTGAGQIIIPEVLAKETEPVEYFKEDWGKIILTDAKGVNYTLYAVKGEVDLNKFELPPLPLAGMFDIRFGSGRIAEDLNKNIQSIKMSGIQYPVIVEVENMNIALQDESGKEINTELKPREKLKISNKTINKLIILSSEFIAPVKYALEQNYPNPFNPTTTIKFSIPEVTKATLTIYNMLGERVSVLVNSELEAGNYSYQWNARNIATGLYIYELRTDKFVSVKKMLLLK